MLPVVFGEVDPAAAARALADRLDDRTLLVASSDLSHYHPYAEAAQLDRRCVKAICDMDIQKMESQEACGKLPILTLMHVARLKGWKARLLDYRNSGDTSGDRSRVVGYAAIAFYAPGQENFGSDERKFLLDLAKRSVNEVVKTGGIPEIQTNGFSGKLLEPKACFVTLTKDGALRGCIGSLAPQAGLYQAVMENAQQAATRDPRFSPVQPEELDKIEFEISILTEPRPLRFDSTEELLSKLRPYRDGVILQIGERRATYLPQVWSHLPAKISFLNSLSQKAGCEPSAWRRPGTSVHTYEVECFGDARN